MSDSPAATAKKLMAQLGASLEDWGDGRTQLLGCLDAPPGKKWTATSAHIIALNFHANRQAGWQFAVEDMRKGVYDCDDGPDCEVCEA